MINRLLYVLFCYFLPAASFADPILVGRSPTHQSVNQPYNSNIVATFDENIIAGGGNVTLRNLTNPARSRVIAASDTTQVSISGRVLTIDPSVPLDADTDYAVQFASNAVFNATNVPYAGIPELDISSWNFRTGSPTVVDVLVVYTPAALAFHGTDAGMLAHIQANVAATNDAFARSGAIGQIRLVGTQLVSYVESSSYVDDLNRLTNTSDGIMDQVHTLRNTVGADLVCLLRRGVDSSLRGGLAWQPLSTAGEANRGFSVVQTEAALATLTFAHELGHNLGLGHARGDSQATGIFSDSLGYRFNGLSGTQFRTIMAASGSGTRISHFSNPEISFDGAATGVGPPSAANSANAARTMSIMMPAIAGFRAVATSNAPPTWSGNPFSAWDATVGQQYQTDLEINSTDLNSDVLTHTIVSGPSWLSLTDATLGRVTGTPTVANLGINEFTVQVTDGVNPAVEAIMRINVVAETGGTWLGVSGNWEDTNVWSGGNIPNGAGSSANFTGIDIATNQSIAVVQARTIGNLFFTDTNANSNDLSLSGSSLTIDVSSGPPTINVAQVERTLSISNRLSGTKGLRKMGSGTLILSGTNNYTGNTSIVAGTLRLAGSAFSTTARTYSISAGAVLHNANSQIPLGISTISGRGILRGSFINSIGTGRTLNLSMDAGGLIDVPSGESIFNGGWSSINWQQNLGNLNVDGSIDIWDGNAITAAALTGSGTIQCTTANGGATNFNLGANNGSGTFSGNITASGTRLVSLVKNGTGTQTFSGNATFRGTTTINGGALHFAKTQSLYAGNTPDWVKTKITVNNGGTLAINVGGTSEFTSGHVSTLLGGIGGSINNNGLCAGSTIGFDTTNAIGGNFVISQAIANTTGPGGGAVGLRKRGNNSLVLSGNSTYTGSTLVEQGILAVTGSLGASSVNVTGGILTGNGNYGGDVVIGAGAVHSLAVAATESSQDTSVIAGTLSMAGSTLNLTAASPPAPGIYVIATASVGITGIPTTINYNGIPGVISVDSSNTPHRLLLTIPTSSPYTMWSQQSFTFPFSLSSPSNNPDGDGMNNLQEFAFGSDPTVGGQTISYIANGAVTSGGLPFAMNLAAGGGVDFHAIFTRRKDHVVAGMNYTVQFSADLINWVNSNDAPVVLSGGESANPAVVEAVAVPYPLSVPIAGGGTKKPNFFRVVVTMQ